MISEILIVLFIYLLAKAFGDTCRDWKLESWLGWIALHLGAEEWFLGTGGNVRWNPSLPWTADCWHLMETVKAWCLVYLAVGWLSIHWTLKVGLALVLLWFVGQLFELLYGYILPYQQKGSLWQWLRRAVIFWKKEPTGS